MEERGGWTTNSNCCQMDVCAAQRYPPAIIPTKKIMHTTTEVHIYKPTKNIHVSTAKESTPTTHNNTQHTPQKCTYKQKQKKMPKYKQAAKKQNVCDTKECEQTNSQGQLLLQKPQSTRRMQTTNCSDSATPWQVFVEVLPP